jgi:hypothetical protein
MEKFRKIMAGRPPGPFPLGCFSPHCEQWWVSILFFSLITTNYAETIS